MIHEWQQADHAVGRPEREQAERQENSSEQAIFRLRGEETGDSGTTRRPDGAPRQELVSIEQYLEWRRLSGSNHHDS